MLVAVASRSSFDKFAASHCWVSESQGNVKFSAQVSEFSFQDFSRFRKRVDSAFFSQEIQIDRLNVSDMLGKKYEFYILLQASAVINNHQMYSIMRKIHGGLSVCLITVTRVSKNWTMVNEKSRMFSLLIF